MKYITKNIYNGLDNELKQLDTMIDSLNKKRIYKINPFEYEPEMPKVIWKYLTYQQVSLHRVVDLSINSCYSWNNGFPGSSFILTRCIFENCAYLYDVWYQTDRFIKNNDFNSCDKLIMDLTFGSRVKGVEEPYMPNVLNSIDRLSKEIPSFRNHYDLLCDLTHPNYLAMFNLYCRDMKDDMISHIKKGNGINEGNFHTFIVSLLAVLNSFSAWFHYLNSLYPELTRLSDEDLKRKKG